MLDTIVTILMFLAIIVLTIISIIVHDYHFITNHPDMFFLEILFLCVIPGVIIGLMFTITRKLSRQDAVYWTFLIILKLLIFHILFQLSGLYTLMLGTTSGTSTG